MWLEVTMEAPEEIPWGVVKKLTQPLHAQHALPLIDDVLELSRLVGSFPFLWPDDCVVYGHLGLVYVRPAHRPES